MVIDIDLARKHISEYEQQIDSCKKELTALNGAIQGIQRLIDEQEDTDDESTDEGS